MNNNPLVYVDPSGHDAGFTQYLSPAECLDKSGYTDKAKNEIANALRTQYSVVENTKTPTRNSTYTALGTEIAQKNGNPFMYYTPTATQTPTGNWSAIGLITNTPTSTNTLSQLACYYSTSTPTPKPTATLNPFQKTALSIMEDTSNFIEEELLDPYSLEPGINDIFPGAPIPPVVPIIQHMLHYNDPIATAIIKDAIAQMSRTPTPTPFTIIVK